jgi:hypothetical protein
MSNAQINSNLSTLTNSQLEDLLKAKVAKEKELLIQILHLLAEVEKRRLYSKTYPSLFEYCVKELKYSSGSAQRRIDTMRAMKLMPEIVSKLQNGELQMVAVSKAQSFFRQEEKNGKSYDLKSKREILTKLENKSTRDCERELVAISPQSVCPDRRREIDGSHTELRITMNQDLVGKLDKLKSLLSNKYPHLTDQELVAVLADIALKKLDPSLQPPKKEINYGNEKDESKLSVETPFPNLELKLVPEPVTKTRSPRNLEKSFDLNSNSPLPTLAVAAKYIGRYIPLTVKRAVWTRDLGRCTHAGCGSKHKLQFDHIRPIAKGGATSISNLRLLCQTHNLLAARLEFGDRLMNKFRPS